MGTIAASTHRHKYSNMRHKSKKTIPQRPLMPRVLGQLIFSAILVTTAYAVEDYNFPAVNYIKSSARDFRQNIVAKIPIANLKGTRDLASVAVMARPVETTLDYNSDSEEAKLDYSRTPAPTKAPVSIQNYGFALPVSGKISSPFGMRISPISKTNEMHEGIDIEASKGTSIKAALDGTVLEAAKDSSYGNYIKLGHKDGLTTLYAHCSQLLVKKGQAITKGKIVAKVGDTGDAVGAHLHFEVAKGGTEVDPMEFIGGLMP